MKSLPILKTLLLLLSTTLLLYVNNSLFTIVLFIGALGTLLILKKNSLRKRIIPLVSTVLLLILFHILFNGSLPILQRLQTGFIAGIRLFALSTLVLVYTMTTSPFEMVSIFAFLPKLPQLLMTITFTTVPAIFEESEHIYRVQKCRGLRTSRVNPFSTLFPIVLPIFHSIFIRAQLMTIAMMSRGYSTS